MSQPMHATTRHFIDTPPLKDHGKRVLRPHDRLPLAKLSSTDSRMRVVCVSDTHSTVGWSRDIPAGDVLVHAGDLTRGGSEAQVREAFADICRLPHPIKLVVPGNHDLVLDEVFLRRHRGEGAKLGMTMDVRHSLLELWTGAEARENGIVYLEHGTTEINVRGRSLRVFMSGYTTEYFDWAFMYPHKHDVWKAIPDNVDMLITHEPPQGVMDQVTDIGAVGCPLLKGHVERIRPLLHAFGHIHEGAAEGLRRHQWADGRTTAFCNASLLDERYQLTYKATVIDV